MKNFKIQIYLTAGLLLVVSCGGKDKEVVERPLEVKVVYAEPLTDARVIEGTGDLRPYEKANLAFSVAGIVSDIYRDESDRVKKGALLARLDPVDFRLRSEKARAELGEAEATLEEAEREFSRKEVLFAEKTIPEATFDKARRDLELAKARRDRARAQSALSEKEFSDSVLRAPFDGVVTKRTVSAGEYIDKGCTAYELMQVDPIKIKISLPEMFVDVIYIGQKIDITLPALKDERFEAKLTRIHGAVDTASRSIDIEAEIGNPKYVLKPGLAAFAKIAVPRKGDTLAIPSDAVPEKGRPYVFVIREDGVAEKREIKIGETLMNKMEVLDGILQTEKIAVSHLFMLRDGMKATAVLDASSKSE